MKKKTEKIVKWILGILLFLIIGFVSLIVFKVIPMTAIGAEYGWIPYTTINDQFTNSTGPIQTTVEVSPHCWNIDTNFDSLFWNGYTHSYGCGSYDYTIGAGSFSISGGDGDIKIFSSAPLSTLRFKKDLSNKNFKIDYKSTFSAPINCGPTDIQFLGTSVKAGNSGTIELNPSIINPNMLVLTVNGQQIKEVDNNDVKDNITFYINGCGSGGWNQPGYSTVMLELINPRYKPLFDCNVDNDEVLIFDEFAPGSVVDISKLSYPVQKFCINNPPVIRSFTDRGIRVDTNGEILLRLSEGGSYTVNQNESLRIVYVTKSSNGVLRCGLNEAFNTNTKQCENIMGEGLPDERGTKITEINIGENELLYSQNYQTIPLVIGDKIVTPSAPEFKCDCNSQIQGRIYPGQPENSCWATKIDNQYVTIGQIYNINPYVSLQYYLDGYGVWNGYNTRKQQSFLCTFTDTGDWTNQFKIKINQEGLKIESGDDVNSILLNESKFVTININNSIGDFITPNSGVLIRDTNKIIDFTTDRYVPLSLSEGLTENEISLKTDILGDVKTEVIPYIVIQGKKIYSSNKITINYKVVQDNSSFENIDYPTNQSTNITMYKIVNTNCTEISVQTENLSLYYPTLQTCLGNITSSVDENISVYRLESNKCVKYTILKSQVKSTDYLTLEECSKNIPKITTKMILYISIGVVVILLIIIVAFIVIKRKRR